MPTRRAIHMRRRGATLIELLVIIIVLLTITAIAIPVMSPILSGRKIREAARMVNVFMSGARNRAVQTGRPVGVAIERVAGLPEAAFRLSYAEVPPPWAGDFVNSTVVLDPSGMVIGFPQGDDPSLVRRGDLLKLGFQSHLWRILATPESYTDSNGNGTYDDGEPFTDSNSNNTYDDAPLPWILTSATAATDPVTAAFLLPAMPPGGYPFQVIRQPVKSAAGAMQLPEGVAIDLNWSGTMSLRLMPLAGPADSDVIVMFSPEGSVLDVFRWVIDAAGARREPFVPLSPIFFLVGKREKVPLDPTAQPGDQANWEDLTSLWVTVQPQSGLISCTENAPYDPASPIPILYQVRRYALESLSMGGR
jgi:type II secretory pathway pseudopilin PulG